MDTSTNELSGGGETTKAETTATIASDQDTNNTSAEVTKMEIESVPESTTNITDHSSLKRKNSVDQDGRVSPVAKQMAIEATNDVSTVLNGNSSVENAKGETVNGTQSTDLVQEEPEPVEEPITTENYPRLLAQTVEELRKQVCLRKLTSLSRIRSQCIANLTEQFFLEQNMNYLEYEKWRQSISRPNPFLQNFIEKNYENQATIYHLEQALIKKFSLTGPLIEQSNLRGVLSSATNKQTVSGTGASSTGASQLSKLDPGGGLGPGGEKPSIADRARHEAHVLKRIAELRKSGLWSLKRLPKLVEPARPKTHWDYLLDEMSWMATDFQQERKWKINCCKKLALAVHKHFREKQIRAEQAEKEESRRAQRQAQLVAREVTQFWRSIEKIVKYKQDTLLEEKRKATMNLRLNMIVDQTEKYSSWLMESLNQAASSAAAAVDKTSKSDNSTIQNMSEDDDDQTEKSSDESESVDDESTIEAEELMTSQAVNNELDELRMESELPLEDLLKNYKIDQNYFDKRDDESENKSSDEDDDESNDEDQEVSSGDMSEEDDDEETIEEEERQLRKQQGQGGYQNELDELNADNSLSIEELLAKLAASSGRANEKTDETAKSTVNGADEEASKADEASKVTEGSSTAPAADGAKEEQQQALLNTIADKAQSFQPTGYTLETTQVKTPVPTALLKHPLREYQHVGLDWLVTMHDNKLNGILADEMGLGKTIQTIALLAHLACEKGNWGPHLIVVPTSVMLNWELEFKKWAPGFKILTYYGSPKERKLKRQGWTKSNAFHVCITSYKLVVQDHAVFRRKKWKYFILDEAQNIKNFKSQRWQALLNFQSQRRLLLTGTPLQNNLMELWSLMHFLMPHVFSSHREFQLWFNNPLKSMVEGNQEYNEQIVKRLHKVLRPFILRRLKKDVEKQMPKKYEHILRCKLSKRQRLLYDEFMSLASTRETLAEGRYMSVINILMQLRKVCNHPDLFDPRPTLSPFVAEPIDYQVPSCVYNLADEVLNNRVRSLLAYQPAMPDMELMYSAFACHRAKRLQTPRRLIEEILTTDLSLPPEENIDELKPTIDIDSFFINSTLIGLEICENPAFRHKLKQYLAKSQISVDLKSLKAEHFRSLVQYLIRLNKQKCSFVKPVYGTDLHHCIGPSQIMQRASLHAIGSSAGVYGAQSHTTCVNTLDYEANKHKSHVYWSQTQTLSDLINWTKRNFCDSKSNRDMLDVLSRFVVYVPHVWFATKRCTDPYESEPIKLRIPHPSPSYYARQRLLIEDITDQIQHVSTKDQLSLISSQEYLRMNNMVESSMLTQFPEKRLIQYDCGKLQLLATLLRQLHSETHRVLVFTQMTRMLDILENFLNYHGYKYLRLDGSTGIDKRQMLMERFNNDKRIFAFILSTRSGGIGVNLTGADTVIFYDSDWNPTMDAQAQDRCHRIGQTRDVHIYRLISERTVEENILRKASQKRLLSDMTIEGGCFTTAFLTKHHITELFEENGDATAAPANVEATPMAIDSPPPVQVEVTSKESVSQLEEALAMVEDETDVKAAKELREEVRADIDEFDENQVEPVPESGEDKARKLDERLEIEFKSIETELRPVERYALKFMESFGEVSLDATQEQTDVEMEQVKKDWELTRLKQLKEEEERKAELEEDEMLYSYSKSEIWLNEDAEQMPLWCPLTPPIYESDVFIDHARTRVEVEENTTLDYLYGTEPISESLLPPIYYAKKSENKRMKLDSSGSPNKKQNLSGTLALQTTPPGLLSSTVPSAVPTTKGVYGALNAAATAASNKLDNIVMTRPLFDKPNAAMVKLRRDVKMQKLKGWTAYKFDVIRSTLPVASETSFGKDDWLPNDDFVIIHSLQVLMELPLTLQAIAPGHQANWDLISDLVSSSYTNYFRSALDCRKRFESVILKREEMCLSEIQSKKQLQLQQQQARQEQLGQPITGNKYKQPTKPAPLNICKTKTLRTNQLSVQDNYKLLLMNIRHRFESISRISKRRHPLTFTYVPLANNNMIMQLNRPGQNIQNINNQYHQMIQQQQQSQQYELLLSKFVPPGSQTQPNQVQNSNIVVNAIKAVIVACRQQSGQAGAININPESITFNTPKHLAELKIIKDKQLKMSTQQPERVLSFTSAANSQATTATATVTPIAMPTQAGSQPVTTAQIAIPVQSTGKIILQQSGQVSTMSPQQSKQATMMANSTQAQTASSNNATILSQLQQQKNATTAIAAQLAASVGVNTQQQPSIVQISAQGQHHGQQANIIQGNVASNQQQPITVTTITAGSGSNQQAMILPVVQQSQQTQQPQQQTSNLPVKSQSNTTVAGLLAASQTSGAYYQQQQQRAAMIQQQQQQQAQSIHLQQTQHGQIITQQQGTQQATLVQTSPLNTLVVGTQIIQQQPQQIQQTQSQQQQMMNPSGRGSPSHVQHQQQASGGQTISSLISNNANLSSSPTISILQQNPSQQQHGSQQSIRLYAQQKSLTQSVDATSTPTRKKQQETVQQQLASNMASPSSSSSSLVMVPITQSTTTSNTTIQQQQPNSPQTNSGQSGTHHHHQPPATIKQITQQQQRKIAEQMNKQMQIQQQQQLNQSLSTSLSSQLYTQGSFQTLQQQQQSNMMNQKLVSIPTTTGATATGTNNSGQIVMTTSGNQIQQAQLITNRTGNVTTIGNSSPGVSITTQQSQQIQPTMIVTANTGQAGQYQQINQTIISNIAAKQQQSQQSQQAQQNRTGNIQGPILIRQHPQIQQLVATAVPGNQTAKPISSSQTIQQSTSSQSSSNTIDSLIKSQQQQQQQQIMRSNSQQLGPSGDSSSNNNQTNNKNTKPQAGNNTSNTGNQIITATLISSTNQGQQQTQQAQNASTNQSNNNNQQATFTTVIKPINSVTLSLPTTSTANQLNQQKQSIITTNQPQQLRQFQIMTTMNNQSAGGAGNMQQQPVTQVLIQHHQGGSNASTGNGTVVSNISMASNNNGTSTNAAQSQTIRKVGSASNLASLHQKVQVLNRPGIQIVQAPTAPRLNKPPSTGSATTITTMAVNQGQTSTGSIQVLQQQTQQQAQTIGGAKPNASINFTTQTSSSGSSLASLMNSNNNTLGQGVKSTSQVMPSISTLSTNTSGSQQQQASSSSSSQTVKTLLTNSSNNPSIISIHPATTNINTSGLQQAVPINLNSSLSQVLRQFSATNSNTTTTTVASGPVTISSTQQSSDSTSTTTPSSEQSATSSDNAPPTDSNKS